MGWFIDDVNIYTCGSSLPLNIKTFLPLILK
jgi:hypothetical protein